MNQVQAKSALTQKGCQRGQKNKLCSKATRSHKKHIKERKGRKLESIVSLEKLSLVMMVCINIEMDCTFYKAVDPLCL